MTTPEARREGLRQALLTGILLRDRLAETLADVRIAGLLNRERISAAGKEELRLADSLILTFANLAALVQDGVVRLVLILEEYDLVGATRRDQRLRAEAIGLIAPARLFERVVETRNRVAHTYPRDPARQHELLRQIAGASEAAIGAFDDALRYTLKRYFGGSLGE